MSSADMSDPAIAATIRRHEERLQRDPGSLAFAHLADLYRKAGRARDAVSLCRAGLARYPHYTTARLILAKALVAQGDLAAAKEELAAILQASPSDPQAYRLAAEIERRLGRLDAAASHLETAIRLDSGDRESRALLGLLRAAASPMEEAGGLSRVLSDETFATLTFGTVCLDQGLADEAVQVFARIVRKDPDNVEAQAGLEAAVRARLKRRG